MSSLPGQILLVLVVAGVLAFPLSLELLRRCRNEIRRLMNVRSPQGAGSSKTKAVGQPVPFEGTPESLFVQLQRAPWRSAVLYWVAGLAIALYVGLLLVSTSGTPVSPARTIPTAVALAWPGFLSIVMTAGVSPLQRWGVLAGGYGACLLVGVWAYQGTLAQAVVAVSTLWLILNLPPMLYLATFFTRPMRAVGPMVLLVTLLVATGVAAMLAFLLQAPLVAMPLLLSGLHPLIVMAGLLMVGAFVGILLGAWLLRRFAKAYQRNGIGDEGIALATLWLTFILFAASFHLLFEGLGVFGLGLLAFPLYLTLVWAGRRLFITHPSAAGPTLLLLRVFENGPATRDLFHAISRHWRHVGPMMMIAGHDLAADVIEPNDVMAYLTGVLDERFVRDPVVTFSRLDASPAVRDPDGRFRYQQLFCFDDSWFEVAEGLIGRSGVVLIDLRGYKAKEVDASASTDKKPGIYKELEACAALGAWSRTVVLCNDKLSEENTPSSFWGNRSSVAMVKVHQDGAVNVPALLRTLAGHCLATASVTALMVSWMP